jgi:hypothetical protein
MNTSVQLLFRIASIAYAVLTGFYVLKVLVIGPGALPDAAAAYLTWWVQQPISGFGKALTWAGNVALAGSVIAALGMVAFARWARPLFVICIAVLTGGELLLDLPVLQMPVEHFVETLLGILAGGIIVFAYWSRISDAFEKEAT